MFNIDKNLNRDILQKLLKLEIKESLYYTYVPISDKVWEHITESIYVMSDMLNIDADTRFQITKIFENAYRPNDNPVDIALASINLAIKLCDLNEKTVAYTKLYAYAHSIKFHIWKYYLQNVNITTLIKTEYYIVKRLNYYLIYITPITYIGIYIIILSDIYKHHIIELIWNKIILLLLDINQIKELKRYLPSEICLASIYYCLYLENISDIDSIMLHICTYNKNIINIVKIIEKYL